MRRKVLIIPFAMKKILYLSLVLLLSFLAYAANASTAYHTATYQPDIHTLRVRYANLSSLKRPFLILPHTGVIDGTDDNNTLEISFDKLSHDPATYTYTVYHLNSDMTRSDLQSTEYLQGFTTEDITDYEYSNNTQQIYIHYSFFFPNEDMRLTASGNYVVHIYEDGDTEKTVADVVIQVVEPIVKIQTTVKAHTTVEFNGRYQQLDIDLDTRLLNVNNINEISLFVQQNNRSDNAAVIHQPTYIEPNRLRYENHRQLVFEGGNEYRHFDTYSVYYAGTNVNRMFFDHNDYHAFLEPDDNQGVTPTTDKTGRPYTMTNDANGQWVVNVERTDYIDTDAEYVWVHWFLPYPAPLLDGSVYVNGDLFGNELTLLNRMSYDNERRGYYLNAYLKQGAYEYQYVFLSKSRRLQSEQDLPPYQKGASLINFEGSHWETENEYTVLVYYRETGSRADRLVGFSRVYK